MVWEHRKERERRRNTFFGAQGDESKVTDSSKPMATTDALSFEVVNGLKGEIDGLTEKVERVDSIAHKPPNVIAIEQLNNVRKQISEVIASSKKSSNTTTVQKDEAVQEQEQISSGFSLRR